MQTLIPETTLSALSALPDSGVSVLLRHAHRERIVDGTNGDHVELTPEGVAASEALGQTIAAAGRTPGRLLASPVPRCLATATGIIRGAGWQADAVPDRRLGQPGAFVEDDAVAFAVYEKLGTRGMVRAQIEGPNPLAGMRSVEKGLRILLEAAVGSLDDRSPHLDLLVTHDSVLAMFLGGLFTSSAILEPWPKFLDGVFIWREDRGVAASWRGQTVLVPR